MGFRSCYIVKCSSSATINTRMCGVDLVESFADQTGPLVVLTRCEDVANDGRNRVCGLRLSDIDNDMDTFFDECKAGTISESELPWDTSRSCVQFSVSKNNISLRSFSTHWRRVQSTQRAVNVQQKTHSLCVVGAQ